MKNKKIWNSLVLFSLLLGTFSPAVAATETSSSSTTVESSSSSEAPLESSSTSSSSSSSSEVPVESSSSSSSSSEELPSSSSSQVEDSSSTSDSSSSSTTGSQSSSEVPAAAPSIAGAGEAKPEFIQGNPVLEAIVGADDQYRVNDTKAHPYSSVVFLEMVYGGDTYNGTGVLIAPDLVLTVAHNVYDRDTKKWADRVYAAPGKSGSSNPYGVYSSLHYYVLRGFKTAASKKEVNFDIAVIRLSRPVVGVKPLSVSTSATIGERIQLPGYPGQTPSKRYNMYTSFGELDDMSDQLLGYTVDAEQGNSGSPILNSRNEVIGVHSIGLHPADSNDELYGIYNAARRVNREVVDMINLARNGGQPTIGVSTNRETKTGVVYRLYNPRTKQYFYTKSLDEADILKGRGFNFEGRGFITADSGKPVYRLYHAGRKAYVYTTNVTERNKIVREGWKYEGVAWYSAGNTKVYRLFNPQAKVHMYTTIWKEVEILKGRGWKYEGVTFYTLP